MRLNYPVAEINPGNLRVIFTCPQPAKEKLTGSFISGYALQTILSVAKAGSGRWIPLANALIYGAEPGWIKKPAFFNFAFGDFGTASALLFLRQIRFGSLGKQLHSIRY